MWQLAIAVISELANGPTDATTLNPTSLQNAVPYDLRHPSFRVCEKSLKTTELPTPHYSLLITESFCAAITSAPLSSEQK